MKKEYKECENKIAQLETQNKNDVSIQNLNELQACVQNLKLENESLHKLQNNNELVDHPNLKSVESKLKEWSSKIEDILLSQIQNILKLENKNVYINKAKLIRIINQKSFFDQNSKLIDGLKNLSLEITKALVEAFKAADSVIKKSNNETICLICQDSSHDLDNQVQDDQQKLVHIMENWGIILEIQREYKETIIKNISVSATRINLDATFTQTEEILIQALTDLLFPFVRNNKQFIEEKILEIEFKS